MQKQQQQQQLANLHGFCLFEIQARRLASFFIRVRRLLLLVFLLGTSFFVIPVAKSLIKTCGQGSLDHLINRGLKRSKLGF